MPVGAVLLGAELMPSGVALLADEADEVVVDVRPTDERETPWYARLPEPALTFPEVR